MSKTKRICTIAVLAALSTALYFIQLYIPDIRIAVHAIPLMFAGVTMNRTDALLTGVISGILQQLLCLIYWPISIAFPFWALAPVAWCYVCFAAYKLVKNRNNKFVLYLFVVICGSIAAHLCNSLAYLVDPYYNWAYFVGLEPERLFLMFVMILPYTAILVALDFPAKLYREDYALLNPPKEEIEIE